MKNYTYPKSFFVKKNQHFLNPFLAKIKLKPQYNNAENAMQNLRAEDDSSSV
jgi:hypothetical protein